MIHLKKLDLAVINPYEQGDDVHVNFELKDNEEGEKDLYLYAFTPNDQNPNYGIRLVFEISTLSSIDTELLINQSIEEVLPFVAQLVVLLNSIIKKETN